MQTAQIFLPLIPLVLSPIVEANPVQDGEPEGGQVWHLSLKEARAMALLGNLDLRESEEAVQQAHASYLGSFGAFEWNFKANATYRDATREVTSSFLSGGNLIEAQDSTFDFSFNRPLTTGAVFDMSFSTNLQETNATTADSDKQTSDELSLSFTQPLWRGRGTAYATASQQEDSIRYQEEVERWRGQSQSTLVDVELAYWDLRGGVEAVEVQRSSLDLGQALLERRRGELQAGVGTELAVLESETEVATRTEALLSAINQRRQLEDALKTLLLGSKELDRWSQSLEPTDGYPDRTGAEDPPLWRQALIVAMENRTELRQAQWQVRLAEVAKSRSLSEQLSKLDLILSASANSVDADHNQAFNDILSWEAPTYSAQLAYDMPIGNTTARSADRRADSVLRGAWVKFERAERDVIADVRSAVREVNFRTEALLAAEKSLGLARRQLKQEEARNKEGLSTNYQVLEVQQSYVESLSSQRQARAEWAKAWVHLQRSQGLIKQSPWVSSETESDPQG
ncbi:MAG: TolC family protein [bacterium]|nr:TolC family protein [bacterium]